MTNRELAQKLGISPAALSMIINCKPGISDAKRQQVLQQLEEWGYSHLVKKTAASFAAKVPDERERTSSMRAICFLIYKRDGSILEQHPYFMLMMDSISAQAQACGYQLLLKTWEHRKGQDISELLFSLEEMDIRGVLLFATEMLDEDIQPFEKLRIPYIVMDNSFPFRPLRTIAIDNLLGTFQAIEYLVHMRHQKIGYLQSSSPINSFAEREQGYRAALAHFDLPLEDRFVFRLPFTEEGSCRAFGALLGKKIELPTAFVADDDTIASGVLRALTIHGIRVPEDVSLVGFNDRPTCQLTVPPLTSIQVPRQAFGEKAVKELVKCIEAPDQNGAVTKMRICTSLKKRNSVQKNLSPV